ncbi:MAG TPA: histidine phosphatase family protein [Humibacter sp.]|nr:histidine phosphatase family protein [Humibacter sp.]
MSGDGTRLTLVRHGETDWNLQRRIQGSTDVPLNETGRGQARLAGEGVAGVGYSTIHSSPQARALETAGLIAAVAGLGEPDTHYDLREREFGPAEGMTDREIALRFPHGIPGQETRDSVVERALPVLLRLAERHVGEAILVVTHGAVISSIVRRLTAGERPAPGEAVFNLSLSHFEVADGTLRLERFNVSAQSLRRAAQGQDAGGLAGDSSPAVTFNSSSKAEADAPQV